VEYCPTHMDRIDLIRDASELEGTACIELLPGKYQGKCWGEGSVFLTEEAFGFFEKTIEKLVPAFDHYAFVEIADSAWISILKEMTMACQHVMTARDINELLSHVQFYDPESKKEFGEHFAENKERLIRLFTEVAAWIASQLKTNKSVSVLGL
jgi:hypothetical protein